jgi:hypothetical protein
MSSHLPSNPNYIADRNDSNSKGIEMLIALDLPPLPRLPDNEIDLTTTNEKSDIEIEQDVLLKEDDALMDPDHV